jgi:hypothetical protein
MNANLKRENPNLLAVQANAHLLVRSSTVTVVSGSPLRLKVATIVCVAERLKSRGCGRVILHQDTRDPQLANFFVLQLFDVLFRAQ